MNMIEACYGCGVEGDAKTFTKDYIRKVYYCDFCLIHALERIDELPPVYGKDDEVY